jgi:chemotaxis protein histidine kinase CheA
MKQQVLINLVGELVVNSANLTQISNNRKDSELIESVSHLNMLINDQEMFPYFYSRYKFL